MSQLRRNELEARLRELELEYELAREGLSKGRSAMRMAVVSGLATLILALLPLLWMGKEFLSGTHIVIIFLALIAGLLVYFAYVFGRSFRLKTEIMKTRKLIELTAGDKVR